MPSGQSPTAEDLRAEANAIVQGAVLSSVWDSIKAACGPIAKAAFDLAEKLEVGPRAFFLREVANNMENFNLSYDEAVHQTLLWETMLNPNPY